MIRATASGGSPQLRRECIREFGEHRIRGALHRSAASVSLAVTGVLGPDSDEDSNPAGLVYFAVCREGLEPLILRRIFDHASPDTVRRGAVEYGLHLLLDVASR
jgi:nicotinamide-nucleotide amidase